jgi:hypothetical protein
MEKKIKELEKIKETELDFIYSYLGLMFEDMDKDEQDLWIKLINEIDPENYDD